MAASRQPKMSLPTQAVLDARKKYPDVLKSVASYFGEVPYMTQRMDSRAADKKLVQMTPEQMTALAQSDPAGAEQAAARIQTLQARQAGQPPLPAQDTYEPEV